MFLKVCLLLLFFGKTLSAPFLFDPPQLLTNLLGSASAAVASPITNVARLQQTQDLDDDDFFKDIEDNQPTVTTPAGIFRQKFDKIVQKFQFLSTLARPGGSTTPPTNSVPKDEDDFDRDFNEDLTKEREAVEVKRDGYFYNKPPQRVVERNSRQQQEGGFSPSEIGVFLVELIGGLAGLFYGAMAQLNYQGGTTAAPI